MDRRPDSNDDIHRYPGAPRWVKVFGIVVAIPVLLFVILMLAGGPGRHGPGRHLRSSEGAEPTARDIVYGDLALSRLDGRVHTPGERGR